MYTRLYVKYISIKTKNKKRGVAIYFQMVNKEKMYCNYIYKANIARC